MIQNPYTSPELRPNFYFDICKKYFSRKTIYTESYERRIRIAKEISDVRNQHRESILNLGQIIYKICRVNRIRVTLTRFEVYFGYRSLFKLIPCPFLVRITTSLSLSYSNATFYCYMYVILFHRGDRGRNVCVRLINISMNRRGAVYFE